MRVRDAAGQTVGEGEIQTKATKAAGVSYEILHFYEQMETNARPCRAPASQLNEMQAETTLAMRHVRVGQTS